jgi:dienelactone hydrolase
MARFVVASACVLLFAAAVRADELDVFAPAAQGEGPAGAVRQHLMRLAVEALDRRAAEYEKVKTPDDIAAWQNARRQFFVNALGGFPERTPLNARVVDRQDRDGYRLEKVIYESQPKHFVTALLYLPTSEPPYPGVIVPCGHSDNGKASEPYQRVSILLAKNGIAALCYDPIDQGERFQLLDAAGKPQARGTVAHCLTGVGSILLGRNTATYRVWDGMRSLDYLESRPEIDAKRLGCTGNSGGGTLTSYLMALDSRIVCAAPSCYLCGFRRLLETIGPQDAEQDIHGQLAFGMDHADYVLMRAPQPTLMCTATHDFFDIGGAWDAYRQATRFYTRLGVPQNVAIAEADEKHGFTMPLRVATVQWMRRWLLKIDEPLTEPDFAVLSDDEARCTPDGQVMRLPEARSVYDLNLEQQRKLADARSEFWKQLEPREALGEVRRLTGIRALAELPKAEATAAGVVARDGYRIEKHRLQTEPDLWLPALLFVPEKRTGNAYLYLHEAGKQADAAPGRPIEKLVRDGHVVLALDVRGAGEMQRSGGGSYGKYLGPEWTDGFVAYLLARPYLAMRTEDILQAARWLTEQEAAGRPAKVHLLSIGRTGPPALHAAALEPQLFAGVALNRCLRSWTDVVATPLAVNQFINVVHGALRVYDLPDLAATLPAGVLTIAEPVDALEQPVK